MHRAFQSFILASALVLFSNFSFAASSIVRDPINFADYKGKWVIISYWATWCNICMEEIPHLNDFYREHRNQVVMFGFNYDDGSLRDLPRHIQESGVAFPTLAQDPKSQFGIGRIRGLPTMLVIGPDGRLKRVLTGSQSNQDLESAVGL